jgi:ATP-binding cassette subfamily F protein 3
LENKKLSVFKGNYSKYKVLKAEKTAHLLKEYEKQQEERAHMQEYVDRNLVRASTTKMAQSRRNALEKMEIIEKPFVPPTPPRFQFSYAEKSYENVLEVNGLKVSAGDKTLIDSATFSITRGEKCAIVGDNGTGKTTLLKTLLQNRNPAIQFGRFIKTACYDFNRLVRQLPDVTEPPHHSRKCKNHDHNYCCQQATAPQSYLCRYSRIHIESLLIGKTYHNNYRMSITNY